MGGRRQGGGWVERAKKKKNWSPRAQIKATKDYVSLDIKGGKDELEGTLRKMVNIGQNRKRD